MVESFVFSVEEPPERRGLLFFVQKLGWMESMSYLWDIKQIKTTTMTYAEFKKIAPRVKDLQAKQAAKTITAEETKELFAIMFGEEYMASDDKGSRKQYAEQ